MLKPFNEIFESFTSVMELLRNEKFQDLLENYERAKKVFMVGYEVTDEVSSQLLFEKGDKADLKPEDYLFAFSEFVKEKQKEIEAIGIILNKPKSWNTKALNELKKKLEENEFAEKNIRRAHKIVYQKDLIDIISMVKHAAKKDEPLLTIDERVDNAIKKITKEKKLNYDQLEWMHYIKEHLKQNMTLDEDDLNDLPVFTNRGGIKKFKKVFGENFKIIINEINTAIAA